MADRSRSRTLTNKLILAFVLGLTACSVGEEPPCCPAPGDAPAADGTPPGAADPDDDDEGIVGDLPLIIAFRLGRRTPTARYPFGYRRAEDLVGLLIALVIALSAALIIWESINALFDPRPLANLGWVLAAGLVGAAGNELVAIYRIRTGPFATRSQAEASLAKVRAAGYSEARIFTNG